MADEPELEHLVDACTSAHDTAKVLGLHDIQALLRAVLHLLAREIVADGQARAVDGDTQ